MKRTYDTGRKARQWARHLRPYGKRCANKSTRRLGRREAVLWPAERTHLRY